MACFRWVDFTMCELQATEVFKISGIPVHGMGQKNEDARVTMGLWARHKGGHT